MSAVADTFEVVKWNGSGVCRAPDELAAEAPLEIRVRRRALTVTMRTPGDDADLAAGFLLSEGIIGSRRDLLSIAPCRDDETGNVLNVVLAPHVRYKPERLTRHVFTNASCGLCGKATIDAIEEMFPPIESAETFAADTLAGLPQAMRDVQTAFDRTGGLHAAAIFSSAGELIVLREDIGRHNAVDKAIGRCLTSGPFPLDRHVLLVSSRCSFEIVQKALAARLPVVAAISAPSGLAAEFAYENGQTLIGFLRSRRMNVYSHPARIVF
jgi:FdhD protein